MDHGGHAGLAASSAALVLLLVVLPSLGLAAYLFGAGREQRAQGWSPWRTAAFAAGVGLICAAMLPPVAPWAHGDLRGHMVQHLLLGMFAPIGLALGAPGTLLLRQVPVATARAITALLATPPLRILIHPITAALLDIGGMYVLYLTPLYALSQGNGAVHVLLHVHFVLSGYLFTWSIAGPDPAPHRPGMGLRLAVLFLATAAHAMLGKIMYGYGYPRGVAASRAEVEAAAQWMYYGGDLAELLLAAAFFALWFRRRAGLPELLAGRATAAN